MTILKAGTVLLNTKTHKIGLIYRQEQDDFTFPKGHLEKGETLQECAIRETAEETKRDCKLLSNEPIGTIFYKSTEEGNCQTYMYLAEDIGHSDNTSLEVHDLQWVNWDSVEKKLSYDTLKKFWNEIKDKIKKPLGFQNEMVTRAHLGVYGIIRKDNQILLIKKSRGPYTGLYDLPGGSPEEGETPQVTLTREIKEETGCDLISAQNEQEKTIIFSDFTKESGESGCMQHTAILFDAQVTRAPTTKSDGLDSNGALWVDITTLSKENASPFVLFAIQKTK